MSNYVTAADLRRLELAGVLHATPVLASIKARHPQNGTREDYSGIHKQSYLPGIQSKNSEALPQIARFMFEAARPG